MADTQDAKAADSASTPELTPEQQAMLETMQKRYAEHPMWHANVPAPEEGKVTAPGVFNDEDILRFLKARKWVVKDAVAQMDATLKWRKNNDIDQILDNPHELQPVFKKVLRSLKGLTDKFGRPVYIQAPGSIPVDLVKQYISTDCAVRCHAYSQESIRKACREQTLKLGRPVTKLLSIVDLTGLSTDALSVSDIIKAMFAVDERYYPETLGNTLVVNAPSVFPMIYAVVKKFLDPEVAAKVKIANKDESPALLAQFFDDITTLPQAITPTGTPGMMPAADLKQVAAELKAREEKLCTFVNIARGANQSFELKVDASEKPQYITWWFRTTDTIKYQVTWTTDESKKTVDVKKYAEVDSHKLPIEGFVYMRAAPGKTGTITLKFDNCRTMISRDVFYYLRTRDATESEIANRAPTARQA